jgi:hypothetical protein
VRIGYLSYLLSQNRLDLMGPAIRHLLHQTRTSDVPLLLAVCDHLLDSKYAIDAVRIWNGLADDRQIPFERLQVAEGKLLTDGDFRSPLISRGFDWRLPSLDGVMASGDDQGGLRLTFSGSQPENCEPLQQFVPVQENMHYQLKVEYRTYGIAAASGLEWHVTNQNADSILITRTNPSSERGDLLNFTFVTPAGCRLARIVLAYRRVPGTTRIEGFIALKRVELSVVD